MSALPVLRNSYTTLEDAGVRAVVLTYAVPQSRMITAGGGLTGGGDLSADRALALEVPVLVQNGGTGVTTFGGTNRLLYTSAVDTLSSIATANTSALVTSSTGVPSWTSGGTANRVLRTDGTTVSFSQVALSTDVTGTLTVNHGGTGVTTFGGINTLLYTTAADTLASIATANNATFITSNTGVPSLLASASNAVLTSNGTTITWSLITPANVFGGIVPVLYGGTGLGSVTAGRLLVGNGTGTMVTSANLTFTTATNLLGVIGNISITNASLSLTTTINGGIGGTPALIFTNVAATGLYSGIYFQNTGARQTSFAFATNTSGTPNNGYSMGVDIADNGGSNFFLFDQIAVAPCFVFDSSRRLGLRDVTAPSAILHIPGGDGSAGMGQLKFDGSSMLGSPESGVMEFDGDHLFFTPSSGNRNAMLYTEGVAGGVVVPDGQIIVFINGASYAIATQAV